MEVIYTCGFMWILIPRYMGLNQNSKINVHYSVAVAVDDFLCFIYT